MINDNWRLIVGANIKFGDGMGDQEFDDCRTCNPFPPFTATRRIGPAWLAGLERCEPLGRFRAGPLASASKEDEFQVTLRYRF